MRHRLIDRMAQPRTARRGDSVNRKRAYCPPRSRGAFISAAGAPSCSVLTDPPPWSVPDADKLTPATADDVANALAFALRYQGRKRVHNADEITSDIVAKRLVEHLERSGFVVMKRPPAVGAAALARGFRRLMPFGMAIDWSPAATRWPTSGPVLADPRGRSRMFGAKAWAISYFEGVNRST
jgi:hypothetical protein